MELTMNFLKNNWLNILLVLVGLSAFVIYFFQKRDEVRTAATLLKSQIDGIEKAVMSLKNDHRLGNPSIYNSGKIMNDNLWERYKHLFVKKLSQSENEIIQRFFDKAEHIERSRVNITNSMMSSWEQHRILQHKLAYNWIISMLSADTTQIGDVVNGMNSWKKFEDELDNCDFGYTPDMVVDSLIRSLENFSYLTGTTAYEKIRKISFDK